MNTTMNSSTLFVQNISFDDPAIKRRQEEIRAMIQAEIEAERAEKGV